MVKGLYTAYTGMINEQNRLDILSNNLANADTNGYKKEGQTRRLQMSLRSRSRIHPATACRRSLEP
mgnify:CR=1 FL=1